MIDTLSKDSVGLVATHLETFNVPVLLACGRKLNQFVLSYECYGALNADKSNAILVCHALSGNQHAAGFHHVEDVKPGWWENCIGPGKAIDTDRFFVLCSNNLGGCHGSTGPNTFNSDAKRPWGPDFPIVTVDDWVKTQSILADSLGINRFVAVIGGSLGGMQALQWAISYPDRLKHAVLIASAPKLSAQNIAFNEIARQAIMSDPGFHHGHYYDKGSIPKKGLILARMLGHVTYLSDHAMRLKFGRELKNAQYQFDFDIEFQVESYLRYQGEAFSEKFDANTYLLMTKALDYFDPAAKTNNNLTEAFRSVQCGFLVISFTSDWRFSPKRSVEIVNALLAANKVVSYAEIEAPQGHDSFLLKVPRYQAILKAYMERVADECGF